jgi:DNA polymerase-4
MMYETRNMINKQLPYIMHIDLNSCFAIIEQQANRLLRGKPVAVPAYDTPRGMVIASSYEAKAKGIKLGVTVAQARALAPNVSVLTPDPAKYRAAHRLFKEVLLEYSPDVTPKSIDEFVVDFSKSKFLKKSLESLVANREKNDSSSRLATRDSRLLHNHLMLEIGREIKEKIRERLGEWVTVNIGIAPNRFLAKYAAGFDKPDGMTLIDCTNLEKYYRCGTKHECPEDKAGCKDMHLVDLPGINVRYRARLRAGGVYTPLDFLRADKHVLQKQIFKSIHGVHWYRRLRGYEVDAVVFRQKSIGHQYALSEKTADREKLEHLLMKLCEKTGRRLRRNQYYATGIHLHLGFVQDGGAHFRDSGQESAASSGFPVSPAPSSWHHGEKVLHRLYSTQDIYEAAKRLLHSVEIARRVRIMSVHVYGLQPWEPLQLSLFEVQQLDKARCQGSSLTGGGEVVRGVEAGKRASDAVDAINDRYGEFVITPATMLDMQGTILDRIAFGQVRDL